MKGFAHEKACSLLRRLSSLARSRLGYLHQLLRRLTSVNLRVGRSNRRAEYDGSVTRRRRTALRLRAAAVVRFRLRHHDFPHRRLRLLCGSFRRREALKRRQSL